MAEQLTPPTEEALHAALFVIYSPTMRRISLEIDEERLTWAQRVLGTKSVEDTIHRALDEVVRTDLRRRLADRVRTGEGIDRGGEVLETSRQWRG